MRLVSRHEVAVVTTTPSACNVYCFASWIAYYSTNGLRHKLNVVFVPYAMQQVDGLLRRHVNGRFNKNPALRQLHDTSCHAVQRVSLML